MMIMDPISNYKAVIYDAEYTPKEPIVPDEEDTTNPVLRQVLIDLRDSQAEYGYNHGKVADAWNALGLIRVHMQRNAKAARVCQEHALKIYKSNLQLTEAAITLSDLGYCCERMGEQESALKKYQEALQIVKELKLSESHPCVISTQRAVSRVLRE
jgi:tetratricopeptide (TPR) repeat protein